MAAAVDSVAAVAVVPVESGIAGKRFTLIEQAKGCHAFMAPFFCLFFADMIRLALKFWCPETDSLQRCDRLGH